MTIFFSKLERSFFDSEITADLPEDAKVISFEDWSAIFAGVSSGLEIDFSGERPALVERAPPTAEQLRATALAQRDSALATAALRIAPLQDAVDVDRATDDEVARLKQWKNYRVDLNRIDQQPGFPADIVWPSAPDSAGV